MKITADTLFEGAINFTYNGIPCLKAPMDYALYQKILFDVKPDLIIEIGTYKGGSALYMADILNAIGKGVIHTIDKKPEIDRKASRHNRIKYFSQGWEKYDLNLAKNYKKILIIDDASHNYEEVLGTLNKFHSLVSKDSYFIVEDGIVNELGRADHFNGGPGKAIEEFLLQNKDFMVDEKLCNFFGQDSTFNINGYLKRTN